MNGSEPAPPALSDAVRAELIATGTPPADELDGAATAFDATLLGRAGALAARDHWRAQLLGFGPLEPFIGQADITDVLVNGDGSVWVDRGEGVQATDVWAGDQKAVRRLATRLAGSAGRRLDDSQPWVDAEVHPGIRLHAVLPPVAADGVTISLRLARRTGWDLAGLSATGMFGDGVLDMLQELVRSRSSFLVTGGTGSGKTALLAALLAESDVGDRLVVVEDVRELVVRHPHVVSLQGRSANVEGIGSVTLVDLVRQALRMRPDRLVVGEVRGAEIREMLAALNTGHEGGCATLHANRAEDVPARVVALGALAGLGPDATVAQFGSAVQVVVHLVRRASHRRVAQLAVVEAGAVVPAVHLREDGRRVDGPGLGLLAELLGGGG